jgi:RimJ/RimL family protein N-acetyltransferase
MSEALASVDWPVRTRRLTIRPFEAYDVGALWEIRRLESVARWMTTAPTTREQFDHMHQDPDRIAKTLVVVLEGAVVGDLMLAIGDPYSQREVAEQARGVQAELGWCISPEQAGKGIATEAAAELLRICFEDLGLRRVTAHCFADNVASWRLMERLGMRRELHAVRESLHRSGVWLDGFGYAMLAEEWRSRAGVRPGR